MYHVFICYPRTYLDQVTPLHDALELALRNIYRRDAEVFQDTSDLQAGNKWESDVNTALEHARVMVVVVVPTILESPQCRREMMHFIDQPGKHIVPLICEEVPRLRQLAESVDDHPEGSDAHQIAVCAQALRTWQAHNFSTAVYQSPNESAYKIAVAELARMIRNKLDFEDHAARSPEDQDTAPPPPPREEPAAREDPSPRREPDGGSGHEDREQTETGASGKDRSRRGLVLAGLVGLLAAGGVGLWVSGTTAPDPVQRVDAAQAQAMLSRALAKAAGQAGAEAVSVDPASGILRVTAPPTGTARVSLPLQPAIDPLLKAGFVPGFATDSQANGDTCFVIDGNPLTLRSELSDGATVKLELRVYKRAEPQTQKICVTATSSWQRVNAGTALVGNGVIYAEPREDAPQLRTLRSGQRVQGPFWTNESVPGWVRGEYRDIFGYFRRDLIKEFQ